LYHTCNNLSGLSIAQHPLRHSEATVDANRVSFDSSKGFPAIKPTKPSGGWKSEEERQSVRREIWANALGWIDNGPEIVLGGRGSRLVSRVQRLGG
jgi:protein farnesyltransferase subunit beta